MPEVRPPAVGARVVWGEICDFGAGSLQITPSQEVPTIGIGTEADRIILLDVVAVSQEIQVADDLVLESVDHVRAGRDQKTGKDLFGRTGAADDCAPFEDKHVETGPG